MNVRDWEDILGRRGGRASLSHAGFLNVARLSLNTCRRKPSCESSKIRFRRSAEKGVSLRGIRRLCYHDGRIATIVLSLYASLIGTSV